MPFKPPFDDEGDDGRSQPRRPSQCSRYCLLQCGGCCCVGFGAFLIALGSLMPKLVNSFIDSGVRSAVVLYSSTKDQEHFDLWSTTQPEDVFMLEKFYFFNQSDGGASVLSGGHAALSEVGPYTLRRHKTRKLVRFDDTKEEVVYTEWEYSDFKPALSGAGLALSDVITAANLPAQMVRNSLSSGAHPDRVIQAALAYEKLRQIMALRNISVANGGGSEAAWTVAKPGTGVEYCANQDCGLHGECLPIGICQCKDGYTGTECRDEPDPCLDVNCGVHGICNRNTGYCTCYSLWTGARCEVAPTTCTLGDIEGLDSCLRCCLIPKSSQLGTCSPVTNGLDPSLHCINNNDGNFQAAGCSSQCSSNAACNFLLCDPEGNQICSRSSCNCKNTYKGECMHQLYAPPCSLILAR